MDTAVDTAPLADTSKADRYVWIGRVISGFMVLALAIDVSGKLFAPQAMIANSPPIGLPDDPAFHRMLGAILAVSLALYAWPRTAFIGAILLTAYLGGAIATHVRVGSPLFSHTLFGVYFGVAVWAGIWFRDRRVRELVLRS